MPRVRGVSCGIIQFIILDSQEKNRYSEEDNDRPDHVFLLRLYPLQWKLREVTRSRRYVVQLE